MRRISADRWMRVGAGCAAIAALVSACGRSDEPGQTVRSASYTMQAEGVRGNAPAWNPERTTTVYNGVITSLRPVTGDGLPGETAAANLMTARSHAGVAAAEVERAAALEREALAKIAAIRGAHNAFLSEQARAAALEAFDPSGKLAELDAQIGAVVDEASKTRAAKESLDGELAQLEAQATQLLDRAKGERDAEAKIRQEAVSANAVKRAELITAANEHRRTADALDKEASFLRAEAAHRAPQSQDLQSKIDELTGQSKLLGDAKKDLQGFAGANKAAANEARASATVAAQQVKEGVAALATVRGGIPELAEKAGSSYQQALSAARAAGQGADNQGRGEAKLAGAFYRHAAADLHAARATGLEAYAALLTSLATAEPKLPDAAEYSAKASEASRQRDEAVKAAAEAYTEAKAEYESAGGSAEVSERLKKVAASLEALKERNVAMPAWLAAGGPKIEVRSAAPAGSAAPAAGGTEGEVRAAIEKMLTAAKSQDLAGAMSMVRAKGPEEQKLLDAAAGIMGKFKALDDACKAKFGSGLMELAKQSGDPMLGQLGGQMGSMPGMPDLASASPEDFSVTVVDANTATVSAEEGGESLTFKKIDGDWKIELELPPGAAEQMEAMKPMFDAIGGVFGELAGEVNAGKYANANDMMTALSAKFMGAMMKAGGPQGGGRRGGGG